MKRDPRELFKEGNKRRLAIRIKNDSCRVLQFKDAIELLLDQMKLAYIAHLTRWISGRKAIIFRRSVIREASFLHILPTCALNDNLLSISKSNKAVHSTLHRVLSLIIPHQQSWEPWYSYLPHILRFSRLRLRSLLTMTCSLFRHILQGIKAS